MVSAPNDESHMTLLQSQILWPRAADQFLLRFQLSFRPQMQRFFFIPNGSKVRWRPRRDWHRPRVPPPGVIDEGSFVVVAVLHHPPRPIICCWKRGASPVFATGIIHGAALLLLLSCRHGVCKYRFAMYVTRSNHVFHYHKQEIIINHYFLQGLFP
jgi:hypothetical protein